MLLAPISSFSTSRVLVELLMMPSMAACAAVGAPDEVVAGGGGEAEVADACHAGSWHAGGVVGVEGVLWIAAMSAASFSTSTCEIRRVVA